MRIEPAAEETPVGQGEALLGRVVDAAMQPLDGGGHLLDDGTRLRQELAALGDPSAVEIAHWLGRRVKRRGRLTP